MQLKFQYNKTALQRLRKQLAIRERALPTLKNKEAALRVEVKKVGHKIDDLKKELNELMDTEKALDQFWVEFPDLVHIEKAHLVTKKIAGIKVPAIEQVDYRIDDFSIFNNPAWFMYGASILKQLVRLTLEIEITNKQFNILSYARKKTTQKVNLYEKVQIPAYRDALLKIKRFLEDKENLMKAAQKIVKERNQKKEAAL